ncbi:hypothetical protein B0H67DRAFT_490185 [Lasiosphaeris hirsuta]|uniref:RNA polymerase II subunit B1 CTD phosphatase RPAP2 homolog n=1 Tax=Lasiosphaeris hirsuta TaxID=260670 RepID=A0AA40AGD3_9PEZI|nr:hypothetical protein B0H67DRAFT_490185 [Lasiosphaeris hirsuta]
MSTTSTPVPRGILKKAAAAAPPPANATPPPREQQITLHQAQQLQRRLEEEIKPAVPIETFERLSQLPRVRRPSLSAARPSPEDAREFLNAVQDFLPREYSDLIEERNCLGSCGYALCPRPRRRYEGEWKVLKTGIAKTADLNMWCSDECARRALYIKVQLDNPSYIRKNGQMVIKLELKEEQAPIPQKPKDKVEKLVKKREQLEIDKKKQTTQDAAALAAERGDVGRLARQVEVTIRERSNVAPAKAPEPEQQDANMHLFIEGHKMTFGIDKDSNEDSDDDYLPATIRM